MDASTYMIILGLMFWFLCVIGIVCLLAYAFIDLTYYAWEKEDRFNRRFKTEVEKSVKKFDYDGEKIIDNVND